ncbi:RagB/SusD family nutrient uptake outer membrane protein [Persicobacter diffluens]|uniref:RagB/SusD family nutrient uptake outer membrane protein n=1 Tax=Persicobacter diffluens TaxID=981 RepID=A0AAN4VVZ0_9BACT|nr:hypothetical protein PEDI_04950 [Persicobacter diffluens]
MKTNKIIIGLLAIGTLFTGCAEDFLESKSTEYATEEVINDFARQDAEAAMGPLMEGVYSKLFEYRDSHDDFGLRAIMMASDVMTDDIALATSNWFIYDNQNMNKTQNYRRTRSTWGYTYEAIRGCNQVIVGLSGIEEADLTDAAKDLLGQAYAVRGMLYFNLINFYQLPYETAKDKPGVPIYTHEEELQGREPVSKVYDLIINDLETGYAYLEGLGMDQTKMNEYAAAGILARVLAFKTDHPNQWDEVAKYAAIAGSVGMMSSEELAAFRFNSINNKEVLFGAPIDGQTTTFYASFMSHMDPWGPGYAGALGCYKMIADDLYAEMSDSDVRKAWFAAEDTYVNPENKEESRVISKYTQIKKFVDVGGFQSDYIYLRASEFVLLEAEARYLSGDQSSARTLLNKLLANRYTDEYQSSNSGQALLDEIYFQKRVECWGEGVRLFDIKRRNETMDRNGTENHHSSAMVIPTIKGFDEQYIFQIPLVELDANTEIGPGDQNP